MLKIITAPNEILNTVSDPCLLGDKGVFSLAHRMAKLMYKCNGCGIAAPQVGINKRLIVIDCNPQEESDPLYLVNPVILETSRETQSTEEGCLSVPGITLEIERPSWVRVEYYDLAGKRCEIEGDGLLGRCLQHEIDHLDGKTMLETCSPDQRLKALQEYQEALSNGAKPGYTGE